ncbi:MULTISPECIES: tRNA (adenosine(37)-N6)-threonylcarbamoyltransferase complex dimerization subunit type 1 TsaB [Vibrio]|jgi:tRNA threonylcarbamoyladenosine biosynthesis protein TsaB|uniref:tRNA threonylcarbamoyladenosine biosynthesis protein TsaB n=1 Tax=Vibrio harveyi TaxID=669 RepID=A0A2S0S657_VIBHA|nr:MULTISPECIES: tRNA (adenosine(37)-N6)-threonylcarbamoyltransferase complex dimerization subunit type 1 TsaB [Vibrio]MED5503487.1 tRNA (adenosine(37)-N6)-threonylcarbamoyltransferase complex dimerization subunit type 1 TsaB [Pseudomonadota bacterium]AMF98716.1 tRNA (adenosine(37)-N6)-threonylcarbamoyltransferase complex dimerization subunit type 1 TsaB [Vibrio harveyi]ARV72010.1 tRNA N6-adenosine(37)-N6-threonylcarbamoyltransferase complex dimerization subunit TsaB [Vibrio campbellii CAIM 519 |tara:strand:- start:68 stop:769 length:702 start_codon:yes stop_codon:yes gene_type:complete
MSAKILAIDTATENCSVALLVNDRVISRSEVAPRDHTKKVLPMVDEVLKEAGLTLQDLDALAFGRGPGSFTGVRIGIGIAQGLAFGADLPMIGVSTLAAMAQASYRLHGATDVAVAIDARMSEVYWARYTRQENGEWAGVDAECVIPPARLAEEAQADDKTWTKAGTGWDAYQEDLGKLPLNLTSGDVLYPDSQDIVILAEQELKKGNTVPVEESSPVYLRDNVTWKKLPGRE